MTTDDFWRRQKIDPADPNLVEEPQAAEVASTIII